MWSHVILLVMNLIRARLSAYHKQSAYQLALDKIHDNTHFKIFGSFIYVPIASPNKDQIWDHEEGYVYMLVLIHRLL